jgi:predicted DCC family thiol-disulfide oxidoreductase YuxK
VNLNHAILLYDGLCGLCDRAVQFTLRRDRDDIFRFAPLQSDFAAQILRRHALDPTAMNTVVLVLDPDSPTERVLTRSGAAIGVLSRLGGRWKILATIGSLVPLTVRDVIYDRIARNRNRWFGRYQSCPVPSPAQRQKFLAE